MFFYSVGRQEYLKAGFESQLESNSSSFINQSINQESFFTYQSIYLKTSELYYIKMAPQAPSEGQKVSERRPTYTVYPNVHLHLT